LYIMHKYRMRKLCKTENRYILINTYCVILIEVIRLVHQKESNTSKKGEKDMMTVEKKIEAAYNKMEQKKARLKKQYEKSFQVIGAYAQDIINLNRWYEKELEDIKQEFQSEVTKAYTA